MNIQPKNILIVYAHPEPTSFNGAMRDTAVETLTAQGHEVTVSDLCAMGWNAVAGPADIEGAHSDTSRFSLAREQTVAMENGKIAADIKAELEKLSRADMVIFQFPVWWFGMPAILKGWADRVFARGFAYLPGRKYDAGMFKGKLAMVAATTGTSADTYAPDGIDGDILTVFWPIHNGLLRYTGFDVLPPYVAYMLGREDDATRARQLEAYKTRLESIDQTPHLFFHPAEDYGPNERLKPGFWRGQGSSAMSEGPLSGLLVVALEQAVAAPLCTVRLADAGARVIKIERDSGETARGYDSTVKGSSAYFIWLNRGKESAILDLKGEDRKVLFSMLERADVLVQNLVPGALARMGLTPEVIASRFPKLIAVSINGYGQDTPYAPMRAYDMLVQAESGLCAVTGTPETPSKIGVSAADIATGMNAHAMILEALIERGRTGKGRQIEVAMFDGMADWMTVPLLHYEHAGRETGRFGLSHASIYPYRPFRCADGTLIVATQNNGEFAKLCAAFARDDLAGRPEFATNAMRVQNRTLIDAELEPLFAALTVAEAIARLETAGIAWGRYSEVRDLSTHPALRRIAVTTDNGDLVTLPRPAGRDAGFRPGAAPKLGADTATIRREFAASENGGARLGHGSGGIVSLRAE